MRALRVGDDTKIVELPVPKARGEALVRVTLSGICNTDLELARGYMGFRGTIGHEFVGVVEEGGGAIAKGERVVGEINAGCGNCARCDAGDPRHCATRTVLGIVGRDGAHADYLRLPARNLVRVPAGIPNEQAVFVEPLAAACGIVERAPIHAGMRVAILGDGKLGLLCAIALSRVGARPEATAAELLLVGKHAEKLARADRRGIETATIEQARARGRVFDLVVEATGAAAGFELALDLLKPQGTLVLKSTFAGTTPIDAARVVVDEISVIGSRCGRFGPALEQLSGIDLSDLISDVVPLDADALRLAAQPGVLKVLLHR